MKNKQKSYSHRLLLLMPCLGLLVFFVSCAKPDERRFVPLPALAEIDSLLWSQPDSTFVELQQFAESPEADSLDAYNGHYYQLLLSELLYKNDYAQTNREELFKAVGYFDSLVSDNPDTTLSFLDARCHYINGVGYYETDSVVAACEEYLKAVELMENRFKEKELVGHRAQFMALAYTHLLELFSDQYLHEQALSIGKQSLLFYTKYDAEPWHIAWVLDKIGMNYQLLDQLDSAVCYYHRAASVLDDTTLLMYRDIVTDQIRVDYQNGTDFHNTLSLLRDITSRAETEYERMARYAFIGEVYYHEAVYDSAIVYLDSVFHKSTNTGLKRQAAEWLIEIHDTHNNQIDVTEHTALLVRFANVNENSGFIKSQLTELYHNYKQQKLDTIHQEVEMKLKGWIEASLMVLVFIVLLLVYFSQVNKRKQKQFDEKRNMTEAEMQMMKSQQSVRLGKSVLFVEFVNVADRHIVRNGLFVYQKTHKAFERKNESRRYLSAIEVRIA